MKKLIKLWKNYFLLSRVFSKKIAHNNLIQKIINRLVKYRLFKNLVIKFYNKKHTDILEFLEKELSVFLNSYSYEKSENIENEKIEKKRIFSLWLQGYDKAPKIVQKTLKSQQNYAQKFGYDHILLDNSNLYNYISLPNQIIKKFEEGKIDPIKYSDIIRTVLLSKYGGIWLDATIYLNCSNKLDYLESDFYTIKASGTEYYPKYITDGRWALFCLAGEKNSIIFDFLKNIQIEYFTKFDIPIDYFLIDYLMELGYRTNPLIRQKIDKVIKNNNDLYFLVDHLNDTFDENEWRQILKETQIFKCSYKVPIQNLENSYYDNLLNERL